MTIPFKSENISILQSVGRKIYSPSHQQDFLVWRPASGGTVEILDIQVNSERRRGIGRTLITSLFDSIPRITQGTSCPLVWALTRSGNRIAHQFYEACGFRIVGNLFGFYDQNCSTIDAIIYGKTP